MSRARIHREVLKHKVLQIIQNYASELHFIRGKSADSQVIFMRAEEIKQKVVEGLLNDYAAIRKAKTERVV